MGSDANVAISISEVLKANVGGTIKSDSREIKDQCTTMNLWYWYVENYVRTHKIVHHKVGSFTLNCMDETVLTFEPLYYQGPVEVLYR